jgi:hypothetical protein
MIFKIIRKSKKKRQSVKSVLSTKIKTVYHQLLYFPGRSSAPGLSYNNELLLLPNKPMGLSERVPILLSSSSRSVRGSWGSSIGLERGVRLNGEVPNAFGVGYGESMVLELNSFLGVIGFPGSPSLLSLRFRGVRRGSDSASPSNGTVGGGSR